MPRSNLPLNFWSWLRYHSFPHGWPLLLAFGLFIGVALAGYRRGGLVQDLALVGLVATVACMFDIQIAVTGDGSENLIRHLFLSNVLFDLALLAAGNIVLLQLCDGLAARLVGRARRAPAIATPVASEHAHV